MCGTERQVYRGKRGGDTMTAERYLREWYVAVQRPCLGGFNGRWYRSRFLAVAQIARGLGTSRRCGRSLGLGGGRGFLVSSAARSRQFHLSHSAFHSLMKQGSWGVKLVAIPIRQSVATTTLRCDSLRSYSQGARVRNINRIAQSLARRSRIFFIVSTCITVHSVTHAYAWHEPCKPRVHDRSCCAIASAMLRSRRACCGSRACAADRARALQIALTQHTCNTACITRQRQAVSPA